MVGICAADVGKALKNIMVFASALFPDPKCLLEWLLEWYLTGISFLLDKSDCSTDDKFMRGASGGKFGGGRRTCMMPPFLPLLRSESNTPSTSSQRRADIQYRHRLTEV